MCKIHVLKLACGHRVTCQYSKCRGTFTQTSRSKRKDAVRCKSKPCLTLKSKGSCCRGPERRKAQSTLKDHESGMLKELQRSPRHRNELQEYLARWSKFHARLEELQRTRLQVPKKKQGPVLPRRPQPRTSQLRGSLLRYEIKPSDIVELTNDFEPLPDWLA